ncbi:MAG: hypothetical protein AAGH64_07895 [Planctomycetota bacterium]
MLKQMAAEDRDHKPGRSRRWLLTALCVLVVGSLVAVNYVRHARADQRRFAEFVCAVQDVVEPGMDEHEVSTALQRMGLVFGEPHSPTGDNSYYQILIPTGSNDSFLNTVEYTITGSGRFFGSRSHVIVELDADRRVRAVY